MKTSGRPLWRSASPNWPMIRKNDGVLAGARETCRTGRPVAAGVGSGFVKHRPCIQGFPINCENAGMPAKDLFSDAASHGTWPQWNDAEEDRLCKDLVRLAQFPAHKAREEILRLEKKHGPRRTLVWVAPGGIVPGPWALEWLAVLAGDDCRIPYRWHH